MREVIKTGKTVEEATELALAELGVSADEALGGDGRAVGSEGAVWATARASWAIDPPAFANSMIWA